MILYQRSDLDIVSQPEYGTNSLCAQRTEYKPSLFLGPLFVALDFITALRLA